MDKSILIRRLSLIKHVYNLGLLESKKPEPLYSVSILLFHDALELFFQLAVEHINASKPNIKFMKYFEIIENKIEISLIRKESIRRLNKSRVAFKHYGTLVSKLDLDGFRETLDTFFEDSSTKIFHLNFLDISLLDLITIPNISDHLGKSYELIKKKDYENSIAESALAFGHLLIWAKSQRKDRWGISHFYFLDKFNWLNKNEIAPNYGKDCDCDIDLEKLRDYIDISIQSFEYINEALMVLFLGIKYDDYVRFNALTPSVGFTQSGDHHITWLRNVELTADGASFCADFVMKSTLSMLEI